MPPVVVKAAGHTLRLRLRVIETWGRPSRSCLKEGLLYLAKWRRNEWLRTPGVYWRHCSEVPSIQGPQKSFGLLASWVYRVFQKSSCVKLTDEEGDPALNTLKRNIFYKPPPHDVVEVTPVSYALAKYSYRYILYFIDVLPSVCYPFYHTATCQFM